MSIVSFEMVDWNFGWFELEIQTDVIEWRFRWVNVHSKFSNVSQCRLKRVIEYWDKSERLRWVSSDWCESYNSEKNQREWVESVHIEVNECRLMWVIEYWEKSERMRWVSADWGEWVRHKVWADPTHRRAVILDTHGSKQGTDGTKLWKNITRNKASSRSYNSRISLIWRHDKPI